MKNKPWKWLHPHDEPAVRRGVTLVEVLVVIEIIGTLAGSVAGAAIRAGRYSIPRDRGLTAADYDVRICSAAPPPQPTDGGRSGDDVPGRGLPPGIERIPVEYGVDTKQRVRIGRWLWNVFDFDIPPTPALPAPDPPTAGPKLRS